MSEARSLTALSESDYEAIANAVTETARGRWFMAEFAKRNRQSDTAQLLTAIGRIERVVGGSQDRPSPDANLHEAAALIADLRLDLERISGRSGEPSSGLAARIEGAAGALVAANEGMQEAAWGLREAGADEAACDVLDRRSTEIHAATAVIESTAQQIGKIADTIAMLDSSLRAFCETAQEPSTSAGVPRGFAMRDAAPLGAYEDIEIVDIDEAPKSVLIEPRPVSARPMPELKQHPSTLLNDDIVFEEIGAPSDPLQAPHVLAAATSEAELRALDALTPEAKLAYFA